MLIGIITIMITIEIFNNLILGFGAAGEGSLMPDDPRWTSEAADITIAAFKCYVRNAMS
jgi:hypothetical protein